MAEYIDRQAAIEAIDESLKCVFVLPVGKSIMDKLPAADVRPVVLCRNCLHARRYTNKLKCEYWSEQTASEIVCEDDFCSYGEKREES